MITTRQKKIGMNIIVSEKIMRHICHHHRTLKIYVSATCPAVIRHTSAASFGKYIVEKLFDERIKKFGTHIRAFKNNK